jgi:hypothetical protein
VLLERAGLLETTTGTTLVALAALEGDLSLAYERWNTDATANCIYVGSRGYRFSFRIHSISGISSCYRVVSYYMFYRI